MKTPAKTALSATQFAVIAACVGISVLPHLLRLPWFVSAPIAIVLTMRIVQRLRGGAPIPTWIKLPLVALFALIIIAHYGNIFGREPGAALACAMLALKLVETETRRDGRAAICFASFVLMSALFFDSSLVTTLALFSALVVFLAALRILQSPPKPMRFRLPDDLLRNGTWSLLAAIPLALCVFLFLPRLASPLWGAPVDAATRTGLGNDMNPNDIQQLLIDDSAAFRVTFDGPLPPRNQLYWRGPVLWYFSGSTWSRPGFLASRPGSTDLETEGPVLTYTVAMEPSRRHWLLALDMPTTVPQGAVRGADMTLVSRNRIDNLHRYHVASAPHYRLEPQLDARHRRMALQLPQGFDPRARALAHRWRSEFNDNGKIIAAALKLFHDNFFYTLRAPLLGRNSVDDFLFDTRRGFCEHFASAFTFLMRSAGIPARVVTGYQGGFYNRTGGYLLVRQSDAHAWSEVWLAGRGWVRVDPTAAVSPQRVELGARAAAGASAPWYQANWLQAWRNQFDLVNRFWNDVIIRFNALRQQHLLTPFGVEKVDYPQLVSLLILSSTIMLGLFAWWVLRGPRRSRDPIDLAYATLCRKLARCGVQHAPAEGPRDFARRVRHSPVNSVSIGELLAQYIELRYASDTPDPKQVNAFVNAARTWRVNV